ncbi:hypothetical protein DXG01_005174 [Tephrocybe rancida]|nr:hypothetical protein DXG01_005174 [Tephrocybe rancida]
MATEYSILLDQDTPRLVLNDPDAWFSTRDSSFLGGTALSKLTQLGVPPTQDFGVTLLIHAISEGWSVEFYGQVPQLYGNGNARPSYKLFIDGVKTTTGPIGDPAQTGAYLGLVYRTPDLSKFLPGNAHNISFPDLPFDLDFMVVKTTNASLTYGERLIVDDSSLAYSTPDEHHSTWTVSNNLLSSDLSRMAYGGTYSMTSGLYASAMFNFTGVAVSVYGIFSLTNNFSVYSKVPPVRFTLDNNTEISDLAPPGRITNELNSQFLWYNRTGLSPQNHTLIIHFDIDESYAADMSPLTLDYITYSAIPFPSSNSSNSTNSSGSPVTTTFSSGATGASQRPDTAGTSSLRTILIASVVGAVAGILLLAALFFFFRKKFFPGRFPSPAVKPDNKEEFPVGSLPVVATVVEPYSETYQSLASTAPSVSASHSETSSVSGSSRAGFPREKSPLSKFPADEQKTGGGSSTLIDSDENASATAGVADDRAQRIQGLVDELHQEIQASGIVVTAASDDALYPPPYQ